jgi:toxin-antitoxin system PIN domain toxin
MKRSSRLSLFPDINVWAALTYERHVHHAVARKWFEALVPTSSLFFCRITQLGFLRLLSSPAVMGADHAKTQVEAWRAYERWLEDDRIEFLDEPSGFETEFRAITRPGNLSPKDWADSYLAAFARVSGLNLVTFDRALQAKSGDVVPLRP